MRVFPSAILGLVAVLGCGNILFGQVKRSRAEAVPEMVASNTVGFGDIWIHSALSFAAKSDHSLILEPYGAVGLGLSQNMSIFAGAVPFESGFKSIIGKSDAHLKLTLPGNDNLRLLGAGLQGDLILSTEQDTSSKGLDTSRPAFTPRLGLTAALDLDLIKKYKELPLKIYVNWSLFDNDRLIAQYAQQSFRIAAEFKGARNSGFAGVKLGLYQRKPDRSGSAGAPGYDERILAGFAGFRYRLLARFSALGSLHFPLAVAVDPRRPIPYEKFGLRFALEFPIFFRETNTEAIRSMIFLEQKKDAVVKGGAPGSPAPEKESGVFNAETPEEPVSVENLKSLLSEDDAISEREKSMKDKRKRVEDELKKIEELLQ